MEEFIEGKLTANIAQRGRIKTELKAGENEPMRGAGEEGEMVASDDDGAGWRNEPIEGDRADGASGNTGPIANGVDDRDSEE